MPPPDSPALQAQAPAMQVGTRGLTVQDRLRLLKTDVFRR